MIEGHLNFMDVNADRIRGGKSDAPEKALEHYERAYKLSTGLAKDALLQFLGKAALAANKPKKARSYAEKMIDQKPAEGIYGDNMHYGHIILGRLAL